MAESSCDVTMSSSSTPWGRPHPRPDHRRRLLPPLHPRARRHPPGRLRRPGSSSGRASARASSTRPCSTSTARWSPPTGRASRAWTSPTTAPGATTRWSSAWPIPAKSSAWSTARQPALARGARPSNSIWRSCSAAGPASAASCCGATPTSPRPSNSTPGTPTGVLSLFGIDAMPNLKDFAEDLPAIGLEPAATAAALHDQGQPRAGPERVKDWTVRERASRPCGRVAEDLAEFNYRSTACQRTYRLVVVRQDDRGGEGPDAALRRDPQAFLSDQ